MRGSKTISNDQWVHVAVTRDENNVTFYVNGEKDNSVTLPNFVDNTKSYTMPILGYSIFHTSTGPSYLDGALKDVRIWNVTRTAEQIAENKDMTLTGTEEGLMNYWKLDGSEGIVLKDSTTSANDYTPTVYWSAMVEEEEEIVYTNEGFNFEDGKKWQTTNLISKQVRTAEAWVKVPTATANNSRNTIVSAYPDSSFSMEIYTNGRPRLWYARSSGTAGGYVADVDVRTNKWTHIAWVCDDTTGVVTCYVNGESVYTKDTIGDAVTVQTAYVGRDDRGGWQYPFVGQVADIRLWEKTLTADEVKYSMNTSALNQPEGLVLDLPLDSQTVDSRGETVFEDKSAYGNSVWVWRRILTWMSEEEVDAKFDAEVENRQESEYSIAVIPDQQILANYYPTELNGVYEWIASKVESENLQMVLNVGDITDNNSIINWERALEAYNIIDGKVPYICAPGNHDYNYQNGMITRDMTNMNTYFPLSMFKNKETYGGSYSEDNNLPDDVANTWQQFEINGHKYLVLALEFGPRDSVLEWANEVVAAHPNHQVIVVTHAYMNYDGTWLAGNDAHVPTSYAFTQGEAEQAKQCRRYVGQIYKES